MSVSYFSSRDLPAGTAPPQVQVSHLFPTPVFLCRLKDSQALNLQLSDVILARERLDQGRLNSNVGGWHSGLDLAKWGGAAVGSVLEAATAIANRITQDRNGRPLRPAWRVECWANVNRHGHANKRHTHPGCYWSGTYYVKSGESGDALVGGELQFHDPRVGVLEDGATAALDGANDGEALIRPEPGLFLLFPSWMPHSVRPYRGNAVRISIAFNLAFADGRAP